MSDSVRPHKLQPTRLHRPWDSPGKNTGVGCHFLPQCMKVKSESEVAQSCPTPSDPMDCSLPGSSAHGIFQARVLEWDTIAFSNPSNSMPRKRSDCELLRQLTSHTASWEERPLVSQLSAQRDTPPRDSQNMGQLSIKKKKTKSPNLLPVSPASDHSKHFENRPHS